MQGETEYFLNKVQTESSALFGDVFETVGVALFFSFISCTPFCAFERLCHISTFFLKNQRVSRNSFDFFVFFGASRQVLLPAPLCPFKAASKERKDSEG